MMKIKVNKEYDDIITRLVINDKEISFDYVSLINGLYDKDLIEDIEFSDDIDEWEREEIKLLINDINKATRSTDDTELDYEDASIPF